MLFTTSAKSPQQEQAEKAEHHAQLEGVEEKGHNLFDHKHTAQGKEMTKNHKKTVAGDIPFISFAPQKEGRKCDPAELPSGKNSKS